jgi:alpha-galactosidase
MPKIAFIGAGSIEFTKNLLGDILSFPEIADATISLHDIDPGRLETSEAVARWTNQALGASASIESHLDRRRCLDAADYVINMIQVGGHAATLLDFKIPKRYGLRQTIADTLGIGGIFRGLRTIPVMLDIASDMAQVCPGAWLLNHTNPMAILCWAVYEGSPIQNVVGLCHSVQHTTRQLAAYVGVPYEEVSFLAAGLNHQAFILEFVRAGRDLYPLLDEVIERDPELARKVRVEIYRRFGFFPTESSEHAAEYVPWFMRHDEAVERFRVPIDEYVRRSEGNLAEYDRVKRALKRGEGFEIERSLEYASLIIHSMETGTEQVIYGNVRNTGEIENLPRNCCIEIPCLVDGAGLHKVHIGALPVQLAALNRTFINVVELTVRAALEESTEHVKHAAFLDPNAAASMTLDDIDLLCDELIAAHEQFLPREMVAKAQASSPRG